MELGLCNFRRDGGSLGERLGARWAHWRTNLAEGVPDDTDLIACAAAHGLAPVVDLFTEIDAVVAHIVQDRTVYMPSEDFPFGGLAVYADRICGYCDQHPQVTNVEIWGSAPLARLIKGKGRVLDYSRMLEVVYEKVKTRRPDLVLWTGGYETSFETGFIVDGLVPYAPHSFDVCNLQPFLSCRPPLLNHALLAAGDRLDQMRYAFDKAGMTQGFGCTGFGIPTLPLGPPPPSYGTYWRVAGGANALTEEGAGQWYMAFLEVLEARHFHCACLLLDDFSDQYAPRYINWCGLRRRDGVEKAYVQDLIEWGNARATLTARQASTLPGM